MENQVAVVLETSLGLIGIRLNKEKAPLSVANFLHYIDKGHYTNTIFHRVIDGFMIQGGGFEPGMKQKPTNETVENEAKNGLKNRIYSVAMARTSAPHSASAQFFINVKNNEFLDYPGQDGWGYSVFGEVIEGRDVVDAIKKVKTSRQGMFADVPVEDVVIKNAYWVEFGDEGPRVPKVTPPEVKEIMVKTIEVGDSLDDIARLTEWGKGE